MSVKHKCLHTNTWSCTIFQKLNLKVLYLGFKSPDDSIKIPAWSVTILCMLSTSPNNHSLKSVIFPPMGESWLPLRVSKFHDSVSRKIHRVNGVGLLWQMNSFSTQCFNVLFVFLSLQFPFPYGGNIFSQKQKYVHINIWLRFLSQCSPLAST